MENAAPRIGTSTLDHLYDQCALSATQVFDVKDFKTWIREFVRPFFAHGALACGLGRINSAGVSMDYVVTVDYPIELLAAIRNPAGGIDTPLMRRWLATRKPVFLTKQWQAKASVPHGWSIFDATAYAMPQSMPCSMRTTVSAVISAFIYCRQSIKKC